MPGYFQEKKIFFSCSGLLICVGFKPFKTINKDVYPDGAANQGPRAGEAGATK